MRPTHIALAVLVTAVWGVNFVVIEVGLGHFPPLLFSALRFLAAALPAVFFVGRPKVAWKWVIGVGLVLGVAKFGLLFVGMDQGVPAGLSSLVLQIQAVFTALFAAVALGERPGRVRLLGMAVALAGIAVAAVDEGTSGPLLAFTLVIAAAACWGVSNVLTRKASPPDALNFMVWVSAVPVLPLLGLSLLFEGPDADLAALRALDGTGIAVILYVAWVTTVFGFGAWGFLLRRYPASSVAPFSLLVPVFGMSSAALLLSESASPLRWCAAALLVGGVALTSLSRTGGPTTPLATETVPAEPVPAETVPAEPVLGAPVFGEPIPAVSASTGWAPAEPTPAPSTAAANTPAANTPAGPLTPESSPTRA
ncbi:EamA family transporter [Streptomyces scopuliridis]|uniref:EamA family transporter n=1 Tax=Streptomyces scopuliridis TaxID=452529 RepID=A0ACD4ZQB6_9ACTN|nr:EamA family transporter [Streptomyces scopuliridis]WSB99996.1 EamA family transporter [Streptomyces scopuliridis]WSC06305.1 EamA family transporter [Streptomyces scopuliridis]